LSTVLVPELVVLRAAPNAEGACGDDRFKHEVAEALGQRVASLPRDRLRR
jgi:hypothetical protein